MTETTIDDVAYNGAIGGALNAKIEEALKDE